jgi:caffeoyl-CoA O-methyltransferase
MQERKHILTDQDLTTLQQQARTRREIEKTISSLFAPEDEGLQFALRQAAEAGLPQIQISAIQGKLLQLLATMCNARKILEIGALGGYSGIWLARALPAGGRLITLELNPAHARLVAGAFARAGLGERTEVRQGKALELLPQLGGEAPFDLVFIDADKAPYPQYLEWAMRLSRHGSIIVADNCIRAGRGFHPSEDEGTAGVAAYNQRVLSDPHLLALALAMDEDYTDGFTIAVVNA